MNSSEDNNFPIPHAKLGPAAAISWVRNYAQQLPQDVLELHLKNIEKWLVSNSYYKEFVFFLETIIEHRRDTKNVNQAYNRYSPLQLNISLASANLAEKAEHTFVAKLAYAAQHGWGFQDDIGRPVFRNTERHLNSSEYAYLFCAGHKIKGALPDHAGSKALNGALQTKDPSLATEVLVSALSEFRFSQAIGPGPILETIGILVRRGHTGFLKKAWNALETSNYLNDPQFVRSLQTVFDQNAAELVSRKDEVLFGRILAFTQNYPDLHNTMRVCVRAMAFTITASQSPREDHQFALCNLEVQTSGVPCWNQAFHEGLKAGQKYWEDSLLPQTNLEKALQEARRAQERSFFKKTLS